MIKIFVVSHKDYDFPQECIYIPIQVGNGKVAGFLYKDSVKDNISHLNPFFCELTALYWIWMNDDNDIIGLAHYRRYFSSKNKVVKMKKNFVMDESEVSEAMKSADIIVAKPRNYFITTIENHYRRAHHSKDYDVLRETVIELYPDYIKSFDTVMHGKKLSLYNMFVAKREVIDSYCNWLFNILFSIENKIDYQSYDSYQKRVFGFMAERLFNVWLEHHKGEVKIQYNRVNNIEGEKIFSKGVDFLKRQLF
ncbi:DUF4422 domain-containing protein [Pectobacterium parmentieri]|uniref:Capsular biosynthesis protein n=2 Tax=Pectobacterium parmentieri TaxID=1905730 RepID=A0A0H3IB17_PECPM|nr:DUF4422 domain-containing protein [Pectobacterium parmentieri]AFI91093.1 Capsular biosynthesis protein [Pectobacterium parmentieri]AYH32753.1 DUF4422 domain-containing protein [Pectobacterium parmentieri]MCL6355545.1 DUF4422 domain-containing protein [Pectobacterium parmentieri]MCL6380571.1 DUF4422 domain-containing protein [Pectobacterium parmentieri]QRN28541.1 DUF4422 domain-containing protein [Pectobacterium parmentieri]